MKRFFIILISMVFTSVYAEDDRLFEASFDTYSVNADFARGGSACKSFANPDLQLRMFPGVNNKGNSIHLDNNESCVYAAKGNFNPKQGTVTLWIAPQNWKAGEPRVQVFFEANLLPKYRMLIYKNNYRNCFYFLIEFPDAPGTQKAFQATSFQPDSEWPAGKWHRLDATWDSDGMKFYIDGLLPKNHQWHRSSFSFPSKMVFPEPQPHSVITLGTPEHWRENPNVSIKDKTAFDLIRILDRPLGAIEIKTDYEKTVPTQFGAQKRPNLLTIPKTNASPVIDGKIGSGEWDNATVVPLNELLNASELKQKLANARAFLQYNDKNLCLAIESDYVPQNTRIKEHDGNLWEDDSAEFHIRRKGALYQIIINGNGMVYDAKNASKEWDSGIKTASSVTGKGWILEFSIPLENIGPVTPGEQFKGGIFLSNLKNGSCYQGWNDNGGSMFSSNLGDMIFGIDATSLRMEIPSELKTGHLDLRLGSNSKNPLKTSGTLLAENGEKIVHTGNLFADGWKINIPSGKQCLSIQIGDNTRELFRYEKYFVVDMPLELKFTSLPSKSILDVTVHLNSAEPETMKKIRTNGLPGKLVLMKDGKVYSAADVKMTQGLLNAQLSIPGNLPSGQYWIRGTFGELENEVPFRVPDMTPYKLKIADDRSIPEPWTPLTRSGERSFKILDREYFFKDGPAPVKVTSRGSDVLAVPPAWTVNGQSIQWSRFHVDAVHPDVAELSGTGSADGLTFQWKGELWFEGIYKLVLIMSPDGKKRIDSFHLRWSVPAEFGKYVLSPLLDPWSDNKISKRYEILQPNSNRDFFIWTIGCEKGFLWWPKSTANWVNSPSDRQITLTRTDGVVKVDAAIISKPAELTKSAEYTMVFMATPAKPVPSDARSFNLNGWGKVKHSNAQIMGWGTWEAKDTDEDCTSAAGHVPVDPVKFGKVVGNWSSKGITPYLYSMPAQVASNDAEYDYFFAEWAKTPTYTHSITKKGNRIINEPCCGHTPVTDLLAYRADKLFREFPNLGGLYYDLSDVRHCDNVLHGCGGIDAFGKPYMSSIALNLRENLKRIYKVSHTHKRKLMLHAHSLFNPVAHSFSDYWWPGEQYYSPLATNPEYFYSEGITPEEFQSELNREIKGVALVFLPQYGRVAWPGSGFPALQPRFKEFMHGEEYAIRTMTPMLVHDIPIAAEMINWSTLDKWWEIKSKLNFDKAKFHGYWLNNALKSSGEKVFASWYELEKPSEYSRLFVVSNLSRIPQKAGLILDPAQLGITEKSMFTDLWNNTPLTLQELDSKIIPGNHFLMIGVK